MLRFWILPILLSICACSPRVKNSFESSTLSELRIPSLGPVPPLPEWKDNPATEAKKNLGRLLFADRRLSGSGITVCGNCHPSTADFQSGSPLDLPDRSYPNISPSLHRNAPSLLNLVYAPMMRWDGSHFTDLADAMVLPLAEANMNLSKGIPAGDILTVDVPSAQQTLKERLMGGILAGYQPLYKDAFGIDVKQLSAEEIWRLTGQALAVYIRIAVSRDSAFDRWNAGDDAAISDAAKRGLEIFRGEGTCMSCHHGPFFSDFQFHNISTSLPDSQGNRPDEGRFLVTGIETDRGAFLTPSLRSVARSSPYYHDGSQTRLINVLRHLTHESSKADPLHDEILDQPANLSDAQLNDLIAFLKTLDGAPINRDELKAPASFP